MLADKHDGQVWRSVAGLHPCLRIGCYFAPDLRSGCLSVNKVRNCHDVFGKFAEMEPDDEIEDITIRRADSKDMDAVCGLWMQLADDQYRLDDRFALSDDARTRWRNDYPLWIKDRTQLILIASTNTGAVGFIHCRRFAPGAMFVDVPEVYVEAIFVNPEYRRMGLGREFLQMAREWSMAIGAERLRFNILARNADAIRFWESEGSEPAMIMATITLVD